MKYLAILKDSVREAIDNKVIYVMIALSLLVTLFVLTTSFTPLSAQKTMDLAVKGRLLGFAQFGEGGPRGRRHPFWDRRELGEFSVRKVEVLRGEPDAPESAYRVLVALVLPTEEKASQVRKAPGEALGQLRMNMTMAQEVGAFKVVGVRVADDQGGGKGEDARAVLFEATTEPVDSARLGWAHEYSLFGGAVPAGGGGPLGMVLFISAITFLGIGSLVALLASLIITAFFIPNMLRKGTVDLLLVKPIHRWTLLVYKYIGGLTFIFINTTIAVVGMWLALGLRSGVWANSFLLMIFVYTFFFAIIYAVSTLFAVLTRSAIVAILVTCGVWFLFFIIGQLYSFGEVVAMQEERDHVPAAHRSSDNAFWKVVRGIHFVLPRTRDLDQLGNEALLRDFTPPTVFGQATRAAMGRRSFDWAESITVSLVFIAVMLGLSCWRFATKDY
jgi:ABC-type transport system involved in multi-copper enzyme maturation permease subunit